MAFSPDGQRLYVTAFDTIYEIVPLHAPADAIPALSPATLMALAMLLGAGGALATRGRLRPRRP
jgi:hypothetical protein